ncbi:MAG: hypothetical protein ACR2RV_12795 [Verrucomicrobiales bacterium]
MRARFRLFLMLATLFLLGGGFVRADSPQPLVLKKLCDVEELKPEVASVEVIYHQVEAPRGENFSAILALLAKHKSIRHLRLCIPNSSSFKKEYLESLREFKSLESLEIRDMRSWSSPEVFEQIAAIEGLRNLKMYFG